MTRCFWCRNDVAGEAMFVLCESCQAEYARRAASLPQEKGGYKPPKEERTKQGLCRECAAPLAAGSRRYCPYHLGRHRERAKLVMRRRRAAK